MSTLLYEEKDSVGLLTVNRPVVLNALSHQVIKDLYEALSCIEKSDVRCLILTGAGEKSFVAGADVAEMAELDAAGGAALCVNGNAVMHKLETLPMPVIAAVNGFALGGGLELALSCDIRLASENASFALPEVSLGIIPGYGGLQRLARLIGPGMANELAFSSRRIKADEALSIGLVNAVYSQSELKNEACSLAAKIAAGAPLAVRAAKRVLNLSIGLPLTGSHLIECNDFAMCFATRDQKIAMSAFVNKVKPGPFIGA